MGKLPEQESPGSPNSPDTTPPESADNLTPDLTPLVIEEDRINGPIHPYLKIKIGDRLGVLGKDLSGRIGICPVLHEEYPAFVPPLDTKPQHLLTYAIPEHTILPLDPWLVGGDGMRHLRGVPGRGKDNPLLAMDATEGQIQDGTVVRDIEPDEAIQAVVSAKCFEVPADHPVGMSRDDFGLTKLVVTTLRDKLLIFGHDVDGMQLSEGDFKRWAWEVYSLIIEDPRLAHEPIDPEEEGWWIQLKRVLLAWEPPKLNTREIPPDRFKSWKTDEVAAFFSRNFIKEQPIAQKTPEKSAAKERKVKLYIEQLEGELEGEVRQISGNIVVYQDGKLGGIDRAELDFGERLSLERERNVDYMVPLYNNNLAAIVGDRVYVFQYTNTDFMYGKPKMQDSSLWYGNHQFSLDLNVKPLALMPEADGFSFAATFFSPASKKREIAIARYQSNEIERFTANHRLKADNSCPSDGLGPVDTLRVYPLGNRQYAVSGETKANLIDMTKPFHVRIVEKTPRIHGVAMEGGTLFISRDAYAPEHTTRVIVTNSSDITTQQYNLVVPAKNTVARVALSGERLCMVLAPETAALNEITVVTMDYKDLFGSYDRVVYLQDLRKKPGVAVTDVRNSPELMQSGVRMPTSSIHIEPLEDGKFLLILGKSVYELEDYY